MFSSFFPLSNVNKLIIFNWHQMSPRMFCKSSSFFFGCKIVFNTKNFSNLFWRFPSDTISNRCTQNVQQTFDVQEIRTLN
ncbi:hypothetical protein PBCV1_a038R [Paramecium bursaria Chlorella virus 1]|uniref:Uncharacterized protein n=1 Tax=Paramecium bursaria Chlorella virus 1 TaxID=10506 RepID=Q89373_PBCV1|nr:hypothetical protein PBCV1_a038R [Paramecium bursaria Chlorella virus 1]AAC96406.1 hypothetical protein [Paramecium bursaria Chlorella virus 1]